MTAALELIEVVESKAIQQILALRVLAWRSFIQVDPNQREWTDKFDASARHWAILDEDVIVAAGRLSIHEQLVDVPDSEVYGTVFTTPPSPPIASMNRLVVHPSYRGLGLSDQLDEVRISAAERAGCSCVIGYTPSGDKRLAQLVRKGFQVLGTGVGNQQGFLKGLVGFAIYCPLPRSAQPLALSEVAGSTIAS
jgi:GNAT superfamily N-acetyltransferase